MQERIRFRSAWLEIQDPTVFRAYSDLLAEVRSVVTPALKDAWETPPITEDSGMNLNMVTPLWEPQPVNARVRGYLDAVRERFRWWNRWQ